MLALFVLFYPKLFAVTFDESSVSYTHLIGEFLQQAAEAVSTGMESVQDAPDQTGAVKVELGTGETPDWSVLYVYEADGICCLEQPYTGIYQGDEALWTVLAADAAPEGRNPQ